MSTFLKNKKILFIGPQFYNYHLLILEKFKFFGCDVTFFSEKNNNLLFSILNNTSKKLLRKYQVYHYNKILKRILNKNFDYLYIIRGFMMPISFLNKLKAIHPNIKVIMYQWDSNKTNEYFQIVSHCDSVFSFDYEDCRLNSKIQYLSLFFTDDITEYRNYKSEIKYDFLFMGSYLPERYDAFLKVREILSNNNIKFKLFMFIPKTTYLKEIIKGKKFDMNIISFKPLNRKDYLYLLFSSKVIIDVSNNGQSGLAMRVIEALGANKKVLTSNLNITKENFYNSKRVRIFDTSSNKFPIDFLDVNLEDEFFDDYSLNNWLLFQFRSININN